MLVIGAGNPMLSDEGIGLRVVEEVLKKSVPGIKAIKGFAIGVDLIFETKKYKNILLIDAMRAGLNPGEYRLLDENEITTEQIKWFSTHDVSLSDAIVLKKLLKIKSKIKVLGIQIKNLSVGEDISKELLERIPEYVDFILGLNL